MAGYAARTREKNSRTRPSRSAAAEDKRSVSVEMSRTTARLSLVECSTACTSSVARLVLLAAACTASEIWLAAADCCTTDVAIARLFGRDWEKLRFARIAERRGLGVRDPIDYAGVPLEKVAFAAAAGQGIAGQYRK